MKPAKLLIEYTGKILIPKIWNDIRDSVDIAEQHPAKMTGVEKKAFVRERMKTLGYDLAQGLFDFAVQLAWMWLQAYLGRSISASKDGRAL